MGRNSSDCGRSSVHSQIKHPGDGIIYQKPALLIMKGQLYAAYVLTVLAFIFAITNLAAYLAAGFDNTDNFTGNLVPLILAICFGVATFTMYKRHPAGWVTFLIGIVILLVQSIMAVSLSNLSAITTVCVYLFMVFYLIDDHVMRMFSIRK